MPPGGLGYDEGLVRTPAGWYLLDNYILRDAALEFAFTKRPAPPRWVDLGILHIARAVILPPPAAWDEKRHVDVGANSARSTVA
ncbi:MAG TPA: hypothetical protein VMO26_18390 [Vicinamibacterales bacterium]|nr:hypothetical protein [Vicinamibacterales bacterium]